MMSLPVGPCHRGALLRASPQVLCPTSTSPLPPSTVTRAHAEQHTPRDTPSAADLGSAKVSRRAALGGLAAGLVASAPLPTQAATTTSAPTALPPPPPPPIILTEGSSSGKLGFEDRVAEFTLSNGLHFIVLPRTTAPVVSAHIMADVGAFQEQDGATGLAHLLEHMAFKGTRRVGARDWKQEAPLLDAMDEVFYELRDLKNAASGSTASAARVSQLNDKLKQLQAQADGLVIPNAYGATMTRAGGVGLNATTSHDATRYFVSLPSNKVELWFALEAERFRAPVFRELYSEKRVIEEERRMRVDDAPLGRFQQEFAARSLPNNYRRPVIGWEQDFDQLGRREVADFFARHYGPSSLTIALVGDVTPEQVQRWAIKYWGGWAGTAPTSPLTMPFTGLVAGRLQNRSRANTLDGTVGVQGVTEAVGVPGLLDVTGRSSLAWRQEADGLQGRLAAAPVASTTGSPSTASRAGTASSTASGGSCSDPKRSSGGLCYSDSSVGGPLVMMGFPRPAMTSPEGPAIQVMGDLLCGSRTSRLTGSLVLQRRVLRGVRCVPSYPGDKYAGMCLLAGVPLQGGRPEAAEKLLLDELERFSQEGPTVQELARVQKSTRTSVLASALSNSAMASLLASYHASTGSWRGLISELDQVAAMTPDQVTAVSRSVLSREAMFTGYVYAKAA